MNLNKENNMIAYAVMGAVNYEGALLAFTADTVKVFVNREDAVTYGESLVSGTIGYDYYTIVQTTVN